MVRLQARHRFIAAEDVVHGQRVRRRRHGLSVHLAQAFEVVQDLGKLAGEPLDLGVFDAETGDRIWQTNVGTPFRDRPSARSCRVRVLPVPVDPAIRP